MKWRPSSRGFILHPRPSFLVRSDVEVPHALLILLNVRDEELRQFLPSSATVRQAQDQPVPCRMPSGTLRQEFGIREHANQITIRERLIGLLPGTLVGNAIHRILTLEEIVLDGP
jgi:hypothetical protein